jgi:hypothetical protein
VLSNVYTKSSTFNIEMKIVTLVLLVIVCSHTNILHAATYEVPRAAASIYVADKDLDGDLDIIVGHKTAWEQTNPTISILENDGKGVFPSIDTSHVFCGYQENIFLQKIDDDEYPDIVTFYSDFSSGTAERYVRIFDNNNGHFETYHDYSLNSDKTFSGISYGDIDGDGDIDIVFYSNNGYFWGYMRNDGTGQFSGPVYFDLDEPPGAIACGDLTGDGKEEILVGSGTKITIYNSVSGISGLTHEALGGVTEIAVKDINNDGVNEIIVCNWYAPGTQKRLLIFSYESNAITLTYSKYLDEALASFFIEDLNGDGYLDIIYNSSYYYPNSDYEKWHTYILYNEDGVSFADPVSYQTYFGDTPNYTSTIRSLVADIDGNGLKDIVALNSSYAYENDVTILFQTEEGDFVQDPQSGIEDRDNLISKTELYQNYPNPFNNGTKIRFSLNATSEVEMSVFNSKGEMVENIVKGRYERGNHSVNYRADDLTSGVYYYELKVNGIQRQVRKMLYLR